MPAARSGYRLRVGAPAELPVSVVMAPHASMLALLRRAASGQPMGAPSSLVRAIQRRLRPAARFALPPLGDADGTFLPDCAAPIPPRADVTVAEQVERLRRLPGEVLRQQLRATFGGEPPARWRPAFERPTRWLQALADASVDAWAVSAPRWQAAAPSIEREVRRVGTAVVRGTTGELLNNLHPRIRYAEGVLTYLSDTDQLAELSDRRLVLLPMIAGPDALFAGFELPDVAYVAYPARGLDEGTGAGKDALALVLGAPRAAVLRALDRPLTVSKLAAVVHCAPSTATYHCQQLEAAGLVVRETRGRIVRVGRTARGAELVDLLSGSEPAPGTEYRRGEITLVETR